MMSGGADDDKAVVWDGVKVFFEGPGREAFPPDVSGGEMVEEAGFGQGSFALISVGSIKLRVKRKRDSGKPSDADAFPDRQSAER